MSEFLEHYGTKRHSGRYPWGSGDDPYQHDPGFLGQVQAIKDQGITKQTDIAKALKMNTTEFRQRYSMALDEDRKNTYMKVMELKNKGLGSTAIGKQLGLPESTVRSILHSDTKEKTEATNNTAEALKKAVEKSNYIDVGQGVASSLGVSETRLNTALRKLKDEGYAVTNIKVNQMGTGNETTVKVLMKVPKGMENASAEDIKKEAFKQANRHKNDISLAVPQPQMHSSDGGKTWDNIRQPENVSSKRVMIRYADDKDSAGNPGISRDGVIQIRRGVKDLDLGNARYAQVRIAVDGTHYLKGMAMYSDDMPDGVDIIFNTNKHRGIPMMGEKDNSVLKPMKKDKDNPFGATIKPGGQRGALNIVNEEGDWGEWSKTLSSQFLSKQTPELAKKQLTLVSREKQDQLNDINSISNNTIRKKLLESFADGCDSDAVHLKAAGLPRQASHVILPIPSLKDNEIYAPNYQNGEHVVLIRYPHGGTFEIPELVVNNKNKEANSLIHNARDAVGITPKTAARLSGADFDGDTVTVIPTRGQKIKTSTLKELEGFDPQSSYPKYKGMPEVGKPKSKGGDGFRKQLEMGKISNLITDMTIKGAPPEDIAKAVKHSMVIIDAEKHQLNWKQSEIDNDIKGLNKKYRGSERKGASTLISLASSEERVPERKQYYLSKANIDKEGNKIFKNTGRTGVNKEGKTYLKTTKSTKMYEELMNKSHDAHTLSSGTIMENIYADYANALHAMANTARKEAVVISPTKKNPQAAKTYAKEVESVNNKLGIILRNKPIERQAQLLANSRYRVKVHDNPDMTKEEKKKLRNQLLSGARAEVGSTSKKERELDLTDREWEAINAGAFSSNQLKSIIDNFDEDKLKKQAMPREQKGLPDSKISLIKTMASGNYTTAEIADRLGVSTATVSKYMGA